MKSIEIAGRYVGPGHPCFIIAEGGVNHNGSPQMARRLIDAAAMSGANAVKFQTFRADGLATPFAPLANYQHEGTPAVESQVEMLRPLELSPEVHRDLLLHSREKGVLFMSSVFGEEDVDLLDGLGVVAFKIPSGELTNIPFLAYVASKGKPLIVSTGMAYMGEVEAAVRTIQQAGNNKLILLHCVSSYPTQFADVNLRAMLTMLAAFGVPVGYSDHTLGIEVALAAVALGACVIEKHFTLDRNLPGPDHRASVEPHELTALVQGARIVEAALGHGRKEPSACEANTAAAARKSLVAACDISAGTRLTEDLIAIRRPGTGLPPSMLPYIIGRTARTEIPAGALICLEWLV